MMSKEKKQVYISEMSSQLDKAEAVIVAHYQGLTVKQLDELRKKMREHGIQFKITKNRITKLALEKTSRKDLSNLNESSKTDAEDPYQQYKVEPSPSKSDEFSDRMIVKTGEVSAGTVQPVDGYNVPKGDSGNVENPTFNKIIRTIVGKSSTNADSKIIEVDTVLGLPGMTHFVISSDIDGIIAPSPVNVMGAAISFCFLTQTHRYIHHQKFSIEGLRMSQYASFKENSEGTVEMLPLDTHLYMNGTASDEHNEKLIDMSERTCYLHATLCEALEPKININFK